MNEWFKKQINQNTQDPIICCLQYKYFSLRDMHRLSVMEWKKVFQENGNKQKQNKKKLQNFFKKRQG